MISTLVVGMGQSVIGIYSVEESEYTLYPSSDFATAIGRIENADEVITYNGGTWKSGGVADDLLVLGRMAGIKGALPISGKHIDMRQIIWGNCVWGDGLELTYKKHFDDDPEFTSLTEAESSDQRNVYMTLKLWELWKQGKLKILNGLRVLSGTRTGGAVTASLKWSERAGDGLWGNRK